MSRAASGCHSGCGAAEVSAAHPGPSFQDGARRAQRREQLGQRREQRLGSQRSRLYGAHRRQYSRRVQHRLRAGRCVDGRAAPAPSPRRTSSRARSCEGAALRTELMDRGYARLTRKHDVPVRRAQSIRHAPQRRLHGCQGRRERALAPPSALVDIGCRHLCRRQAALHTAARACHGKTHRQLRKVLCLATHRPGLICSLAECVSASGALAAMPRANAPPACTHCRGRRLGSHHVRSGRVAADDVPKRAAQLVHVTAGRRCVGGHARLMRVLRPAAALTHATAHRLQSQLPGGGVAPELSVVTRLRANEAGGRLRRTQLCSSLHCSGWLRTVSAMRCEIHCRMVYRWRMQRVRCFPGMRSLICLILMSRATTSLHRHAVASRIRRWPAGRRPVSV